MLSNKLKKKDQYASVFKSGEYLKLNSVIIQHCKRISPDIINKPRFGIIASRKIGNSVKRNFAKRRLRALVNIVAKHGKKNSDYIFVAKKNLLNENFSMLSLEFKKGLNKIKEDNNE